MGAGILTAATARMSTYSPLPPTHAQLDEALRVAEVDFSAAEVHGILTGLLCAGAQARATSVFAKLLPHTGTPELGVLLAALLEATQTQLADPEFSFAPLLPGDEQALVEQVAGLADWCRGFHVGLAAGGVRDAVTLPGDAGEVLRDLAHIAEAELAAQVAGEAEARQLAELVEYVRVGVQLVYETLHAPDG
jgi:hypothetical protein